MRIHLLLTLLLFAAALPATAADSEDATATTGGDCRTSTYCVALGFPAGVPVGSSSWEGAYVFGFCAVNPTHATCSLDIVYAECNGQDGLQRAGANRDCRLIL